jgi:hypothetical protein
MFCTYFALGVFVGARFNQGLYSSNVAACRGIQECCPAFILNIFKETHSKEISRGREKVQFKDGMIRCAGVCKKKSGCKITKRYSVGLGGVPEIK